MDEETKKKIAELEAKLDDAIFSIQFLEKNFIKLRLDLEAEHEGIMAGQQALLEWMNEGDARERNVSREFARQHMHHHVDLDDYVHRAYAKTHPDALKTLEQCRKILGWPEPITDEDPHAFIDRIFSKDWDGSVKPKS